MNLKSLLNLSKNLIHRAPIQIAALKPYNIKFISFYYFFISVLKIDRFRTINHAMS